MDLEEALPVLHVRGTHYEFGYQIGLTFKNKIREYFFYFEDLHTKFKPFYATGQGKKIYDGYLNVVRDAFPQYVEELQGIADGSSHSFMEVFLMHIRVELQTYLESKMVSECSTVMVNNDDNWLIAHNEDTSASVKNRGYIVNATITESGPRGKYSVQEEKFVAFCYPGIIPGNAFSCNSYGMVLTVNALYPKEMAIDKIPRQFLNRAMLTARDPENLLKILIDKGHGIATGCSVNMAFLGDPVNRRMSNYELCPDTSLPQTIVDQIDIKFQTDKTSSSYKECNGYYFHTNMYQHKSVVQMEGRTTSSQHRMARAKVLPPPYDLGSSLLILGDDDDKKYPIYRTPRSSDSGCTVATGIFDLVNKKILVYVCKPKFQVQPILDIPFPSNKL